MIRLKPTHSSSDRLAYLLLALLLLLTCVPTVVLHAKAWDESSASKFEFATANLGPRELEDQTQKAIQREYVAAWKSMAEALDQNRTDLVDQNFVGAERDRLRRQIEQQQKNGMSSKLDDVSHKVEFGFYSPEGTAIELHDTVELAQQTMDGGKSVHSGSVTQKYVVIFTLVEDRWKVRTLQAVR